MSDDTYSPMDQVIPNLWIGDHLAARNEQLLRAHNVHSVLSAMRGRVKIHETFKHFQVLLDDTSDADALALFPQCITFIEHELDAGRGVLVHCQAGMSRSATIAAAYLMYAKELDAQAALELIRKARPCIQPNDGFLMQLDVFYQASYKVSRRNKAMRMFYLERALEEVMNGDGTLPASSTSMFATFPRTPASDSAPATPGGNSHAPRRRIRCRLCRTELAAREHMLDHGQVGPATPASAKGGSTPAGSRRPSMGTVGEGGRPLLGGALAITPLSRRTSSSSATPQVPLQVRRLSSTAVAQPLDLASLSRRSSGAANRPRRGSALATSSIIPEGERVDSWEGIEGSALDDESDDEDGDKDNGGEDRQGVKSDNDVVATSASTDIDMSATDRIRSPISPNLPPPPSSSSSAVGYGYMTPLDLAAQLHAHPKLAALRSPGLVTAMSSATLSPLSPAGGMGGLQPMTPLSPPGSASVAGVSVKQTPSGAAAAARVPPLLADSKCSGYFVEPMKWMEPFLADGQLAGKIVCPNNRCGAKLGNYDWAGVCCSCKEWVTPGFCIHRSKVDEIVI